MSLLVVLPSERDVLLELHSLDESVFNYLVERTDWATGIIGIKSAVAYSRMALDLSENIPRKAKGRNRVLSRDDVINSVSRVVKSGLFERACDGTRKLRLIRVFWRDLLAVDSSVQNPVTTQLLQFLHMLESENINKNLYLHDSKAGSYHKKANPVTTNHYTTSNTSNSDFAMSDDWLPSDHFPARAGMAGFDVGSRDKKLYRYALVDLQLYWQSEQAGVKRNQHGWEKALLRTMVHLRNTGALEQSVAVSTATPAKPSVGKSPIPPVPSYHDEHKLQAWMAKVDAPAVNSGELTYDYCQRMLQWRRDRLNKKKYG